MHLKQNWQNERGEGEQKHPRKRVREPRELNTLTGEEKAQAPELTLSSRVLAPKSLATKSVVKF